MSIFIKKSLINSWFSTTYFTSLTFLTSFTAVQKLSQHWHRCSPPVEGQCSCLFFPNQPQANTSIKYQKNGFQRVPGGEGESQQAEKCKLILLLLNLRGKISFLRNYVKYVYYKYCTWLNQETLTVLTCTILGAILSSQIYKDSFYSFTIIFLKLAIH